ncbi:hypothetical protein F5888DRAFT_478954 [Russula emetica]|nr:hypothetical protein F5888DRAFT_478954 [Russula emetica]
MTDDSCSDCGLARYLHVREDGIFGCPADTSISGPLCQRCHEPMRSHISPDGVSIVCPGRHVSSMQDTFSQYADSSVRPRTRSESPDPLLLVSDKQLSQQHYSALRRSTPMQSADGAVVPLRRSSRLENRRLSRAKPYAHAQARRSSLKMADVPIRKSRSRRVSMRDNMLISDCSYENESVYPAQHHPPRRKSLQPYVLNRMVPAEDMDPIEGFRPFTEIDPGQLPVPVTVREPMKDLTPKPPFEFVWNPSVVTPAVGGMRVRVGQFERIGHPTRDTAPFASSSAADENETDSSMSGTEDYFTAQDWSSSSTPERYSSNHAMPSVDTCPHTTSAPTFPGSSQTEFTQGSALPLQQQHALASGSGNSYSSSMGNELAQFDALAQHYVAAQIQERRLPPLQIQPLPCHATGGPAPSPSTLVSHPFHQPESLETPCPQQTPRANAPFQYPFTPTPTPTPTAPQPSEIEQSHAVARPRPRRRSTMPGTLLPDATVTDTDTNADTDSHRSKSESSTPSLSVPDRGQTEPAVDEDEDWAAREPWGYVHRVLTTSTRPLVMFLKTPTSDIPTAALGALGAELNLQTMLVDNEHWLLIGPRDVNLFEFGVRFQKRARSRDKFVFRLGNLNWGAKVDQIEDEVCKAAMESSWRGGMGMPATLPAQFMAGAMGGFVVCTIDITNSRSSCLLSCITLSLIITLYTLCCLSLSVHLKASLL